MSDKLVWIKWFDCSEFRGPMGAEDCGELAYLFTAGHLVSITDKAVCVCADIADPEWQEDWHRGVTTIPIENVIEMRQIAVGKMPRRRKR